jgi:peroxiredoxin
MMRIFSPSRYLLLFWMLGGSTALHAGFELIGDLPASFTGKPVAVYRESLEQRSSTQLVSATVIDGRFRLRIESEDGIFKVRVDDAEMSFVASEGNTLRVTSAGGDVRALRVGGSADQELHVAYENFRTASLASLVHPVRRALAAARAARNDAEVERLTDAEVAAYRVHRRELNDFTLENLRGSPALYAASLRWDGDHRLDELTSAVQEFAIRHPGLEIARLMEERIKRFRAVALGAEAPSLAGRSPDGTTISLGELRGRHVLVDFWAAWCSPCRIENRNYARLHGRYKNAGFEIFAVSVDENERAWKTAIAKDGANWLHISDLTGWGSPLAARYNVSALPASFLLDPEGKIIAKDARGKELAALLEKHLKSPASPTNAPAHP